MIYKFFTIISINKNFIIRKMLDYYKIKKNNKILIIKNSVIV